MYLLTEITAMESNGFKANRPLPFKDILLFPSKNLIYVIPSTVLFGLIGGYFVDTSSLKPLILPTAVVLMVYSSMIGFNLRELMHLQEKKIFFVSLFINFLLVLVVAYFLGVSFLFDSPGLFAGLAITSLLPTSNMTVALTMLSKRNVGASIKVTVTSLILGSVLAPWYLYFLIGKYVPVDRVLMLEIIGITAFLPLIMGLLTFRYLTTRYTETEFNEKIKPLLPGICAWGAIFIIFVGISTKSKTIFGNPDILAAALFVQAVFYFINYVLAIAGCKLTGLCREDAYTLVYSTVLRNLAISTGLASALFGSQALFMVSLAFLFQPVAVVGFGKLNEKYHLL